MHSETQLKRIGRRISTSALEKQCTYEGPEPGTRTKCAEAEFTTKCALQDSKGIA